MDLFFKIIAIMKLIIVSDKDRLNIRQTVNQFHAFFQSKGEAGGAQSIAVHAMFGDNSHGDQRGIAGIAGFWVQDMMVKGSVFFKVSFVDTRGNYGLICNFYDGGSFVPIGKRLLNTDAKGRIAGTVPNT